MLAFPAWRAKSFIRPAALFVLTTCLPVGLIACFPNDVPTQSKPTCSWSSSPPPNADALCTAVFRTISGIAAAERRNDRRTIRKLAPEPAIASRIIAHARQIRAAGIRDLHVVPSFILEISGHKVGAGFYLGGMGNAGKYYRRETLFLRLQAGQAVLVADEPGQEW